MAAKECGSDDSCSKRKKIIYALLAVVILFFLILIIWATLGRPFKPSFILQDATVFTFNITGDPPNLLTSNFQITLSSRNPNENTGIYYDRLDAYAIYKSQQITLKTSIPGTYQGHEDVNTWSPFVGGSLVSVAPYNGLTLDEDRKSGAVELMVKVDGKIRWKVGAFVSRKYQLYVSCPAFINFGNTVSGVIVGENAVKYTLTSICSVNV